MSRKQGRRRRRGVYIGPIHLLLIGLVVVVTGGFLLRFALSGGEKDPDPPASGTNKIQEPDSQEPEQKDPDENGSAPDTPPASQSTASGISCTLTDLGPGAIYTGDLILVNNWTPFHFPEDQEAELTCILDNKTGSYYVKDSTVYILPHALDALNAMMDAFQAQGGSKSVNVVAGHRTEAFQQHLFDQSAERNGIDHANKYVAKPGGSEHHTGLVVDFSILHADGSSEEYQGQGEYAWINENCQDYGYVVRYETGKEDVTGIWDEPWHFRYIGIPHATEAASQGLCLEEYIDYLRQFPFEGDHLMIDCAGGRYEVWYTQGSSAYLPDSGEYTVSGNNADGVVVTCKVG